MTAVKTMFSPDRPKQVDVPKPPPPPSLTQAEKEAELERDKAQKRKGFAAAQLTGETGLDGALGSVSKTSARGAASSALGSV